jgi:hypothetical protein
VKGTRVALLLWVALIVILVIVELAEITHNFTLPIESAIADPLAFIVALVFTTLLALVGAIFVGVFLSHRILSPTGFTPFEEEMLKMRADLREVKRDVAELRSKASSSGSSATDADEQEDS